MPAATPTAASPLSRAFLGLVAAAIAVLTFHAGAWWVVHEAGFMPPPFPMSPTKPLGLPVFLSLTFWGSLYGIPFGLALPYLTRPLVLWGFGLGVLASLVGWFVVAPIKGQMPVGGSILIPLILNGSWGIGVALILPLLLRLRPSPPMAAA